jgi:hypothetical protein
MAADPMTWTNPYYGVQHLKETKPGVFATVSDHDSFANAFILNLKSGNGFTPIVERDFSTAAEARTWIEQQAKQLGVSR